MDSPITTAAFSFPGFVLTLMSQVSVSCHEFFFFRLFSSFNNYRLPVTQQQSFTFNITVLECVTHLLHFKIQIVSTVILSVLH